MSWESAGSGQPVSLEEHDVVVEVDQVAEVDEVAEVDHDLGADDADDLDDLDDIEEVGEPLDLPAVPRPEPTGDPRVDDAIARLDDLDRASTAEHVAIVDDVQQRLQSALSSLGDDDAART